MSISSSSFLIKNAGVASRVNEYVAAVLVRVRAIVSENAACVITVPWNLLAVAQRTTRYGPSIQRERERERERDFVLLFSIYC